MHRNPTMKSATLCMRTVARLDARWLFIFSVERSGSGATPEAAYPEAAGSAFFILALLLTNAVLESVNGYSQDSPNCTTTKNKWCQQKQEIEWPPSEVCEPESHQCGDQP